MAVSAGIAGRKGVISIAGSSTGTDVEIGTLRNYSVSVSKDLVDITNFDSSGWTENLDGRKSWGISAESLHVSTNASLASLVNFFSSGSSHWVTIQPTTSDTQEWAGAAIVTGYEVGAGSDNDPVLLNFSAQGVRALTFTS